MIGMRSQVEVIVQMYICLLLPFTILVLYTER